MQKPLFKRGFNKILLRAHSQNFSVPAEREFGSRVFLTATVLYMFEIWHTKIIGQQHQIVSAKFKDLNISDNEYGKIKRKTFSQQRI